MTGKMRACMAAALFAAIAFALGLAAAPQLHDRLHHADKGTHECAATLFSSGSLEHSACDRVTPVPDDAPRVSAILAFACPRFVARPVFSLLEHAPPALS